MTARRVQPGTPAWRDGVRSSLSCSMASLPSGVRCAWPCIHAVPPQPSKDGIQPHCAVGGGLPHSWRWEMGDVPELRAGWCCVLPPTPQKPSCWWHGGFQISGSVFGGEKSWVFGLGSFSDWGLWCCQCSAGILGQRHAFARVGLSAALGRSCPWLRSSSQLCPRVCFPGSASQRVLGFACGKELP